MADLDPEVRKALRTLTEHFGDLAEPAHVQNLDRAYAAFRAKGDFEAALAAYERRTAPAHRPNVITDRAKFYLYCCIVAYQRELRCGVKPACEQMHNDGGLTICYRPGGHTEKMFTGDPHGHVPAYIGVKRLTTVDQIKKQFEASRDSVNGHERRAERIIGWMQENVRKKSE